MHTLILALLSTSVALPTAVAAASLTDIASSPNREAINYLVEKRILTGYPDGTFRPKNVVNRAELLKVLVATVASDAELTDSATCFPDVGNEWFAKYICFAKEQGWVNGYADGSFRPNEQVNRAEALKMLINSQGYQLPANVSTDSYIDVNPSDWFAPYVQAGHKRNLLEQTSGQLNPAAGMTREAVAELAYRAHFIRSQSLNAFALVSPPSNFSQATSLPTQCTKGSWTCTEWSACDLDGKMTRRCTAECDGIAFQPAETKQCSIQQVIVSRMDGNLAVWDNEHDDMVAFAKELTEFEDAATPGLDELSQIEKEFLAYRNRYAELSNQIRNFTGDQMNVFKGNMRYKDFSMTEVEKIEQETEILLSRYKKIPKVCY